MDIHFTTGDTFIIGIGWLSRQLYGEGGLFIQLGWLYINFWERPEPLDDLDLDA